MKKNFIPLMMFALCLSTQSFANPNSQGKPITLEDVDTDGNGVMSPMESKRYLNNLSLEEQREFMARKQAEEEARGRATETNETSQSSYQEKLQKPETKAASSNSQPEIDKKLPPYTQKRYGWREGEMKTLDANGDGILQAGELKASAQTKFNAADKNKDGVLSPDETAASLQTFQTQISKIDNATTAKEQTNRLKNRLRNADINNDNNVSKEEYETFMAGQQAHFDQNEDGIISKDEYRTDGERLPTSYFKKIKKD